MPTFEYKATDAEGQILAGQVFSPSLESAVTLLKDRGLSVGSIQVAARVGDPLAPNFSQSSAAVSVRESAPAESTSPSLGEPTSDRREEARVTQESHAPVPPGSPIVTNPEMLGPRSYLKTSVIGPVVGRVPLSILGFYFTQLATMLSAGVPMVQVCETLHNQQRDPRMRAITGEVAIHVKEGRPISAGLQRYPESISPVMLAMVRVGEEGGFLEQASRLVAQYIEREIALRNLYRRLTIYPKITFVSSFVIIGAANAIIASLGKTSMLSNPVSNITWGILAAIAIGVWLFLRVGLANQRIRYTFDSVVLRVPVIGKTMHMLSMAKFGRAFGALYQAGVPITKATGLAADSCGNEYLRSKLYRNFEGMNEGKGIYETFKESGAFSQIVLDMVHTGETTGNMSEMVNKVSEYYEDDAATRQTALATLTGVLILLLVGAYIGYIVVNFYTTYFSDVMKASS